MKRNVDLVVISDVHLGTYGCHARELLNYLKTIRPNVLVLNGDIIDIWQFRKKYFPKDHFQVIQRILKMAAQGTKVYYVTGNHDDLLRQFSNFSNGSFILCDQLVLQLKEDRCWIFHGDIFDLSVHYSRWIAILGGKGYDWLIRFNRWINALRMKFGYPRVSLSQKIKMGVKEAVKYISNFEQSAIRAAAESGYQYVICGHIHLPQNKVVTQPDGKKVQYLNAGDWVENLTALEYHHGRWRIFSYDELEEMMPSPRITVKQNPILNEEEEVLEPIDIPTVSEAYVQIANAISAKL